MVIVVNSLTFGRGLSERQLLFLKKTLGELSARHTQSRFYLIYDLNDLNGISFPANVERVPLPAASSAIARYRTQRKVRKLLEKKRGGCLSVHSKLLFSCR